MEYNPPPFFKQGPSARARLIFFAVLAITLLIADARFNALVAIRRGVAIALYPLQRAALMPGELASGIGLYVSSVSRLQQENTRLEKENTQIAQTGLLAQQLGAENDQLRKLLGAKARQTVKSIAAEILYDARDPSSRKIVLDRGTQDGVTLGSPVIDDTGVIGQATRVFMYLTEVTLLTDKNQTIPVQDLRSGVRAVAYGGAPGGLLSLRFMSSNADIQRGDTLVTSGLDGVYPAGLPVAHVESVEKNTNYTFAQISCTPIGGTDRNRHVLVLMPSVVPAPPPAAAPPIEPKRTRRRPD